MDLENLKNYPISFKLQKLRCGKGLTQSKFAAEIGCVQATVSAWECGDAVPSELMKEKIRKYFGLPYDFFIKDDIESVKLGRNGKK